MKKITLSVFILFALAFPAVAQEGLVQRVTSLEAKVDRILAILEKQQAPDPFQAVSAKSAQYQTVCDANGCRIVQAGVEVSDASAGASGSCGVRGLIGRIFQRRR